MTVRFTRSLGAWLTVMLLGTSFCPLGISASPAVSSEEAAAGDKTATNLVDTAEATLNSDKEMNEARETDAPLMPVNSKPLMADELSFDGVRLGDTEGNLISAFGVPEKITKGSISTTYEWNGVKAQVIKPLPEPYQNSVMSLQKTGNPGMSLLTVSSGKGTTGRGISIGMRRENVLRTYGRPLQVFWNDKGRDFYFVYEAGQQELWFQIKNDKVAGIILLEKEKDDNLPVKGALVEPAFSEAIQTKDVHIAGFSLGETFVPHAWDTWEKKWTGKGQTQWYYPGYAVRESDNSHIIEGLFVVGPDMLTGRGLTVGDSTSTAELLYGAPDKIEVNYSGGTVRSVYIYFLKFRKNMLLIYLEDGKVSSISAISYNKDNPGTAG